MNREEQNHGPVILDEFHGIGGAYVVENGVRTRVEMHTIDHPEGNAPRDRNGKLIVFADPEAKKKAKVADTAAPAAAAATEKGARK